MISGSGGLAITRSDTGGGVLRISNANTYAGTTSIAGASVVEVTNNSGLGAITGGTTVASSGALHLSGGITIGNEALSIVGGGINNGGALRNLSGDNTYGGTATTGAAATRINSDGGTLTLSNASAIAGGGGVIVIGGTGDIAISGVVSGTSAVSRDGTGTLTLSGANTYSGATVINGGTLSLDSAGSTTARLTNTSGVTINTGGILLMTNSVGATPRVDRINNAATVNLAGGMLNLGGLSEGAASSTGVGALTLTATSTLNFGPTGGSNLIQFAGVGTQVDGQTLQIINWEGTAGSPNGTDRLLFAGTSTSFTTLYTQSEVSFNGIAGYGITGDLGGYYEVYGVTAVPEPSTLLGGSLCFIVLAWRYSIRCAQAAS